MIKQLLRLTVCSLLALVSCNTPDTNNDADRTEIENKIKTYSEAYHNHDAHKLAEHWTEEGQYISPQTGTHIIGRQSIEEQFNKMFAQSGDTDLKINVEKLDFQGPNKAIEQGTAIVTYSNGMSTESDYTATHIKQNGQWYIQNVSEMDHQSNSPPPELLKELGWMIGSWIDEKGHTKIETKCNWTLDNHFIKSIFTIYTHNHRQLQGVHYIGVDQESQKLHSWVFDSDGGFGTGIWSRSGNQWTLELSSTLADGRKASSIYTYKLIDANTFKFSSSGREVEGQILPNFKGIVVKRKQNSDKDNTEHLPK